MMPDDVYREYCEYAYRYQAYLEDLWEDACRDHMEDMWAERESEANDLVQQDDGKKEAE